MTPDSPLTFVIELVIKPGLEDAYQALAAEILRDTRAEPGCRAFTYYRSREDPRRYTIVESFRDAAALMQHGARMREKYGPPPADRSYSLPEAITRHFERLSYQRVDELAPAAPA